MLLPLACPVTESKSIVAYALGFQGGDAERSIRYEGPDNMSIMRINLEFIASLTNTPQWQVPRGKRWMSLSTAVACGGDVVLINVACFGDIATKVRRLDKEDRIYCEGWLRPPRRSSGREAPLSVVATKIFALDPKVRCRQPKRIADATEAQHKAYLPNNGHPRVVDGLDAVRLLERLREKLGVIGRNEPVEVKSAPDEMVPF